MYQNKRLILLEDIAMDKKPGINELKFMEN